MPDAGVIVDIEVVTGEESDFGRMVERLDALEATLGRRPGTVTADKAYGIGKVYAALSERDITAVIPPRPSTRQAKAKGFPIERFRYDAARDSVRCPRKKVMTPRSATKSGRWFRAGADACRTCVLAEKGWRGVPTKPTSPPVTAGWSKACMDWPKPCTGWPEPPGADLKT